MKIGDIVLFRYSSGSGYNSIILDIKKITDDGKYLQVTFYDICIEDNKFSFAQQLSQRFSTHDFEKTEIQNVYKNDLLCATWIKQ